MEEYEVGDLVVTYILDSSMAEPELLQYGIIVDIDGGIHAAAGAY